MSCFFAILESTSSPTKQTIATLKELADEQDKAVKQMSDYFGNAKPEDVTSSSASHTPKMSVTRAGTPRTGLISKKGTPLDCGESR